MQVASIDHDPRCRSRSKPSLKRLNVRIPKIILTKTRGFINQGSTLNRVANDVVVRPSTVRILVCQGSVRGKRTG